MKFEDIMDLFKNPFYILNASTRDNRQRILAISDECSLLIEPEECTKACSELTNPKKRLSAEIAWLPGLSPKKTEELLNYVQTSPEDIINFDDISSICKTNLLVSAIQRLKEYDCDTIYKWVYKIATEFDNINYYNVLQSINEDRNISCFPEIYDITVIEDEINERRRYYVDIIKIILENLPTKNFISTITELIEDSTDMGNDECPILIADIVDWFEVGVQEFLEKEERNIDKIIENILDIVSENKNDPELERVINQLISVVKNWDIIAQPIQVSAKSRGITHDASIRVANKVRGLSVELYNSYGMLDSSLKITDVLLDIFAEVDDIVEQLCDDADALNDIADHQTEIIEKSTSDEEEWRNIITYEADFGLIFKHKLKISPEGISWNNRTWDLSSLTRVRWGVTKTSEYSFYTPPSYFVFWGTKNELERLTLRDSEIFSEFTTKLFNAVGSRLISEYIEGLRNGQKYRFGSSVIQDNGIELERYKIFGKNERKFFDWLDVVAWNEDGNFYIANKENKKFIESLSYQDVDNIHILDIMIQILFKTGRNRLSSIFD